MGKHEREKSISQKPDFTFGRINVNIRFGNHFINPEDVGTNEYIIVELANIKGFHPPFINHGEIIDQLLKAKFPNEPETDESQGEENGLFDFKPLGVGGRQPSETKEEVVRLVEQKQPVIVNTDRLGIGVSNAQQERVVNKMTTAQMLSGYLLSRVAMNAGFSRVKRLLSQRTGSDEFSLRRNINKLSSRNISRREFLHQAVPSVAYFLGTESAYGSIAKGAVDYLNKAALNTTTLDRRSVSPVYAKILHSIVYSLPEKTLELLGDEENFYLYYANISGRNLNMTINTLNSLSAFEKRKDTPGEKNAVGRFGLAHMGIRQDLNNGVEQTRRFISEYVSSLIRDYTSWVGKEEDSLRKKELLENFVYIARTFSQPIASRKVEINSDVALPPTGLSIFWEEMQKHSTTIGGNEKARNAFDLLTSCMGMVTHAVMEEYGDFEDENGEPRGRLGYNGLWEFKPEKEYQLLLPHRIRKELPLPGSLALVAIAIQNNTVFTFPIERRGGGEWLILDNSQHGRSLVGIPFKMYGDIKNYAGERSKVDVRMV